jgi:hypothetical protein
VDAITRRKRNGERQIVTGLLWTTPVFDEYDGFVFEGYLARKA